MDKKKESFGSVTDKIKIALFIVVMAAMFFIGLLFFLRPTASDAETREELTKFPDFTMESFLSGEWTSQVSLWFADTYPLREGMISASRKFETLYGIQGEQVHGGGSAETIPDSDGNIEFRPTDNGNGSALNGLYVNGDTAYELYYFDKQGSDNYVYLINEFASQMGDDVNIYNMLVPKHYQFALSKDTVKKIGASDCEEAIEYMYGNLDSKVTPIRVIPEIMKHNQEYIYFRTDHHWTARGAYYAYTSFCDVKGIDPTPLSSYRRMEFKGFLGTLYESPYNKNPGAMERNPDSVEAFIPIGTNTAEVYDANSEFIREYSVVYTGADKYEPWKKYWCFIAGDQPLTKIHNPSKSDGSSIVVIKESYGNAFVPFLVDSYEYVYVIDYRHWSGNLGSFVREKQIEDVLFLNVIGNSSASNNINSLKGIIE